MYAIYTYAAGSTQANVLADVVKLLTGETNKANLSANCVQASTSIISTVAAGWSVYDASAGTNKQAIRALNQDGTTYKYATVSFSSTTVLNTAVQESWNSGTHAATNEVVAPSISWNATNGGTLYIYATVKNFIIYSYSGSVFQLFSSWCFEISRDTIPSGYPCHVGCGPNNGDSYLFSISATQYAASIPRTKKFQTTGDATLDTVMMQAISGGAGVASTVGRLTDAQIFRDASETQKLAVYKIGVGGGANQNGCQLGTVYDMYVTGVNSGINTLDEITYSSQTYVAIKIGSNAVLLFPKA